MSKKSTTKPVSRLDIVPETPHRDSESRVYYVPGKDSDPDPATAVVPDPVLEPIPVADPAAAAVPVPDPDPQHAPHYPSGEDEIMRRHRLVDPAVAEAKTAAENAEVADVANAAEKESES